MTHTLKRLGVKAVVALGLGLSAWTSVEAQSITWLGTQSEWSRTWGVSADGTVVVGTIGGGGGFRRPFRWTAQSGMVILFNSHAAGWCVSADGSVVVGSTYSSIFRWTARDGMQTIGGYWAYGVSADGSAVVGYGYAGGGQRAYLWTARNGGQYLGTLGGSSSTAWDISADGSVVVGEADNASGQRRAFRWTAQSGMVDLGTLGGSESVAWGVSGDGSVVVGVARNASGDWRAFRWTAQGGMVDIGSFSAFRVSADGSVVIGTAGNADAYRAFRWTAQGGVEDLNITYASLLTNGSVLWYANAISPDGRYIVGSGYNAATGREEAYLLDTGPRCTAHNGDVDGSGCVDDADLLAVLFAFGNTGQNLGRVDVNCDGTVDDADLLQVLFNFGQGC